MLAYVALVAFQQSASAGLSQPVTLTLRATPVQKAVAALAESTHTRLEVVTAMTPDVVMVSVKDTPLSSVMQKLATVCSAEWTESNGVWRLAPSAGLRNREYQVELTTRVQSIRKMILGRAEARKKQLEQMAAMIAKARQKAGAKGGKEEEEGFDLADYANPEGDAVVSLVPSLDLSLLAAMRPGDRLVFSTQPTRMQRPLNGPIATVVSTIVKSHNTTASAMAQADIPDEVDDDSTQNNPFLNSAEFREQQKIADAQRKRKIDAVQKTLLIVSRETGSSILSNSSGYTLRLVLYDANGTILHDADERLGGGWEFNFSDPEAGKKDENEAPAVKSTPVELSSDTKALASLQVNSSMPNLKTPEAKRALELMQNPDVYDPLSFLATDSLLSTAKKQGKGVVACLPDEQAASVLRSVGAETATVESFEEDLAKHTTLRMIPDENLLVIAPSHPYAARENRLDRVALGRLIRTARAKGTASLDDLADFAVKNPDPDLGNNMMLYFMMAPGSLDLFELGGRGANWDLLRLYGSFDTYGRQQLKSGGRIPFSSLSPAQAAIAAKLVYGASASIEVGKPKPKSDNPFTFALGTSFTGQSAVDYRNEPTELLPSGLPPDGFLQAKVQEEPAALMQFSGDSGVGISVGMNELAFFQVIGSSADAADSGVAEMMAHMKLGDRRVIDLSLELTPQARVTGTLKDTNVSAKAPEVAFHNLPADIQRRLKEKVEVLMKSGFMNGNLTGTKAQP